MIKPKSRKHEDRIKALEQQQLTVSQIVALVRNTMRAHMPEQKPAKKWWHWWA